MRKFYKTFFILSLFFYGSNALAAVCDPLCSSGQYCAVSGIGTGCAVCGTDASGYPYSASGSDEITDCYACETRVIANGTWPPDSPINYPTTLTSCSYTTGNIVCENGYRAVADSNETYGYKCDNNYTITLNHNDTTANETINITYGAALPNVDVPVYAPAAQQEIKSYFFGYFDASSGGNEYYDKYGHPVTPTYNLTTDLTLFAHWHACSTSLPTYDYGYINNFILENECRYYTACYSGYDNPYYEDTLEHSSTYYSGDCDSCDPGYYCPGPTGEPHKPCPAGMISNPGATSSNSCYYKGGTSGTKFSDQNGNYFYLPSGINIY